MGALYCASLCARSLSFALQRSAGLKWHTYSLCRTTLELFHPFGPELGGILTVSSVPTGRTGVPCEKSEVFPSPSDQPSIVPRARMYRLSRWGATLYHTCVSPRAAPAPSSKSVFLHTLELFNPFGPELGGILTVSSVPTGRTLRLLAAKRPGRHTTCSSQPGGNSSLFFPEPGARGQGGVCEAQIRRNRGGPL